MIHVFINICLITGILGIAAYAHEIMKEEEEDYGYDDISEN